MSNLAIVSPFKADARILIVEDDFAIASMLVELFREDGYSADAAASGVEMDFLLRKNDYSLIVLDGMLPGEDGFAICGRLRAAATTPILMLTARTKEVDRVVGLELGADDYVTKPFSSRELLARVKALLRRSTYGTFTAQRQVAMMFAGWRIDPTTRELIDCEGLHVSLTTAEFDILLAFCQNPGRIITREEMLALTHAGTAGPVERSIDVHVSRVRQRIEPNSREPILIKTVRLSGYIFTPQVSNVS